MLKIKVLRLLCLTVFYKKSKGAKVHIRPFYFWLLICLLLLDL